MVDKKWLLKRSPSEKTYTKTCKIDLHYLKNGNVLKCVNGIRYGQKFIKVFDEFHEIDTVTYIDYRISEHKSTQKFRYDLNDCYYEIYPNNMLIIAHGDIPQEWHKLVLLDITDMDQFNDENLAF
jgi:hypothetical protein